MTSVSILLRGEDCEVIGMGLPLLVVWVDIVFLKPQKRHVREMRSKEAISSNNTSITFLHISSNTPTKC